MILILFYYVVFFIDLYFITLIFIVLFVLLLLIFIIIILARLFPVSIGHGSELDPRRSIHSPRYATFCIALSTPLASDIKLCTKVFTLASKAAILPATSSSSLGCFVAGVLTIIISLQKWRMKPRGGVNIPVVWLVAVRCEVFLLILSQKCSIAAKRCCNSAVAGSFSNIDFVMRFGHPLAGCLLAPF